jgi:hypothetical protein
MAHTLTGIVKATLSIQVVHGADTPETVAWVDQAKDLLWERGPTALMGLLTTLQVSTEEGQKVLNTERGYFRSNAERMQYPSYREQGLPIGSGAVESAAIHLVQQRIIRAGMRWSELGTRHPPPPLRHAQHRDSGCSGLVRDRSRFHPDARNSY